MTNHAYELIISIMNRGYSDQAMEAARSAGARGGTILYARGTVGDQMKKFFGLTIDPEKEVILMLVATATRGEIMKSVATAVGLTTPGRGLSFSLPVEDVVGLSGSVEFKEL